MPRAILLVAAALLLGGAGSDTQNFAQIERGKYLAAVGDCAACHTLPGSGQQFAGGRSIETPFGTLLAPNITPDRETGIGAWTDDEFVDALTRGTGRDGEHLYPAMPFSYLAKVTREDALTIRAYLNSVPAVRHSVTANDLSFPFDIRVAMAGWDALYFTPEPFHPDPNRSAEWNRGAYLVEGLMHCGMCHTPKNLLGADETSRRFQGYALQGWFAPDINNDTPRGLGSWSVDDIVRYLKTGHTNTAAASGPMADEVANSSSKMTEADLHAVATYLKGDSEQAGGKPAPPGDAVMKAGAAIYADECSACHAPTGDGVPGLIPALRGAAAVQSDDPASLLHVVLRGARSVGTKDAPTAPAMPSFAWLLTDAQIAAVTSYVRNAWGNGALAVEAGQVKDARHDLAERSD